MTARSRPRLVVDNPPFTILAQGELAPAEEAQAGEGAFVVGPISSTIGGRGRYAPDWMLEESRARLAESRRRRARLLLRLAAALAVAALAAWVVLLVVKYG